MYSKTLRTLALSLFLFCTTFAMTAQADGGVVETGGNIQSFTQVMTQIGVTTIVLGVLNYFNLP